MNDNVSLVLGLSLAGIAIAGLISLMAWSLVWVYRDAEARGKSGWAVALLVMLLKWPISLLVWIAFRPPTLLAEPFSNGAPAKPL